MKFYFPCSNGIGCVNGQHFSVAVIANDGNKKVFNSVTKNKVIFYDFFAIRGLQYFFCGILAFLSTFLAAGKLSDFDDSVWAKKISKKLYVSAKFLLILLCILFSVLLTYFLLGVVPAKLSFWIMGASANLPLRAFVIALIKVLLLFGVFLILRFVPAMQTFYRFNGAINKISSKTAKNWHKPLNFVNFLIFSFLFSVFMVSLIAININPWANFLVNLAIVLACISFCYEILAALEKFEGKSLAKICLVTSWFVALRPKITQEEVAKVVKLESELKKESVGQTDGVPLSAVVTEMGTKLESSGRYEKSDVDWIIATALGKNRAEIKLVREVSQKQYREIMSITQRRAKGEPLSNIFGFVEFYGLPILVNKKVLTPRAETEILVDEALKLVKDNKKCEVLDLCTGSGAIAIAIAKNSTAKVTATDISRAALQTALANAKKNEVKIDLIESDLFLHLKKSKKFDIIISNPPYIASKEVDKLDVEVKKYDPKIALDGGEDGLDFYRKIVVGAPKHLCKGGVLMFEIGQGQAADVRKIMKDGGFGQTRVVKDYEKNERVIYGKIGT